jgi:hypothetical protein
MTAHQAWGRARRAVAGVAASALLVITVLAAPAGAAAASITVSPTAVAAGGTVTISGSIPTTGTPSCDVSAQVTLISTEALFPQGGFGPTAPRDANGAFTITYVVPTSTPAGTYDIGMRCGGGLVGPSAALQVTAAAAPAVRVDPSLTG